MATRRIVPRNDGEGSIGKPTKQWGDIQTKKINNIPIEGLATNTIDGLMSAEDKLKIDNLNENNINAGIKVYLHSNIHGSL